MIRAILTFVVASGFALLPFKALANSSSSGAEDSRWAGPYIGATIGGGWGSTEFYNNFGGVITSSGRQDMDGGVLGIEAGYGWQFERVVLGLEVDASLSSIEGEFGGYCGTGCVADLNYFGTVRARAGYSLGNFLPYATGGFAWGNFETSTGGGGLSLSETLTGWTAGAGIAYSVSENLSVKAEYLHIDLGQMSQTIPFMTTFYEADDFDIVRLGLSYSF